MYTRRQKATAWGEDEEEEWKKKKNKELLFRLFNTRKQQLQQPHS